MFYKFYRLYRFCRFYKLYRSTVEVLHYRFYRLLQKNDCLKGTNKEWKVWKKNSVEGNLVKHV